MNKKKDKRSLIFHLLYAMDSYNYDASLESIADNFDKGFDVNISPESEIFKITKQVIASRQELDEKIQPLLSNWKFERLGTITKLILRLGIWELIHSKEDKALIINECVQLAKCFAEKDAHKFVNGVLDQFIKDSDQD